MIYIIAALICARGGSKRIHRKNVQMCAGKKLIEWPLLAAQGAERIDRVFVSTEDEEIAGIASQYDAEVIDRPWQLATDFAADGSLVYHAYSEIIKSCGADYIVKLHATSPCIHSWHIDEACKMLDDNPMAVQVATMHKKNKASSFSNYYALLPNDTIIKIFPETPQGVDVFMTSNLVSVYYTNGAFGVERIEKEFYCLAPEITKDMDAVYANNLYASYNGRVELKRMAEARNIKLGYVMDEYSGMDINYPEDIIVAEGLLRYRQHMKEVCGLG